MKSIISHIAQNRPDMSAAAFEAAYVGQHPQGESLTADNLRQAFAGYNNYCRKFRRMRKAKDKSQ